MCGKVPVQNARSLGFKTRGAGSVRMSLTRERMPERCGRARHLKAINIKWRDRGLGNGNPANRKRPFIGQDESDIPILAFANPRLSVILPLTASRARFRFAASQSRSDFSTVPSLRRSTRTIPPSYMSP